MSKIFKSFTVWGDTIEELEGALTDAERAKPGRNGIHFQIKGEAQELPWDSVFISDGALDALNLKYIVVQQAD